MHLSIDFETSNHYLNIVEIPPFFIQEKGMNLRAFKIVYLDTYLNKQFKIQVMPYPF